MSAAGSGHAREPGEVGTVFVTCPACGESMMAPVVVHNVTVGLYRMEVVFKGRSIDHKCGGRA